MLPPEKTRVLAPSAFVLGHSLGVLERPPHAPNDPSSDASAAMSHTEQPTAAPAPMMASKS